MLPLDQCDSTPATSQASRQRHPGLTAANDSRFHCDIRHASFLAAGSVPDPERPRRLNQVLDNQEPRGIAVITEAYKGSITSKPVGDAPMWRGMADLTSVFSSTWS